MSPNSFLTEPCVYRENGIDDQDSADQLIANKLIIQEIKDIRNRVPGCYDTPSLLEAAALYRLAEQSVGYIFEWGIWKGRSSAILNLPRPGNVLSLDHFKGDTTGGANPDINVAFNHLDGCRFIVSDNQTFPYQLIDWKYFTVLVYDAQHLYPDIMHIMNQVLPNVSPGTWLFFHDFKMRETQRAVDKITTTPELGSWMSYHVLETRDQSIILRKE